MTDFDWTNDRDVVAAIYAALTKTLADLVRQREAAGTLTDFVSGFTAGRYELLLSRAGLTVVEKGSAPTVTPEA